MPRDYFIYFCVVTLGATVGLGELLSRYRDSATRMLLSLPAILYVGINGVASAVALMLFKTFDVTFGLPDSAHADARAVLLVLASGLGAMAFFRSSFFIVRVGEHDVAVGPGSFLQLVLSAADRAVDRIQGAGRSKVTSQLMRGVSFLRAYQVLPISCLNLVQGVPDTEQESLGQDIQNLLANGAMSDAAKSFNLGLSLMHVVGEDVLRAAIQALGDCIRDETARPQAAVVVAGQAIGHEAH